MKINKTAQQQDNPERFAYLQSLPPEQRSEAAAIYDHKAEIKLLDPHSEYWQAQAASSILAERRDRALLANKDVIPYDIGKLLFRLHGGYMTSAGQDRAVASALADVDTTVTQTEINERARELVQQRRDYIQTRYGIR